MCLNYPQSVFGAKCRSWYKAGKEDGRVIALWPGKSKETLKNKILIDNKGSALHCVRALEHPRWEDFDYQPLEEKPMNRFYWFGDGQTLVEKIPGSDCEFISQFS